MIESKHTIQTRFQQIIQLSLRYSIASYSACKLPVPSPCPACCVVDLCVGSPTSLAQYAHAHFHPSTLTRLPDTPNSTSISFFIPPINTVFYLIERIIQYFILLNDCDDKEQKGEPVQRLQTLRVTNRTAQAQSSNVDQSLEPTEDQNNSQPPFLGQTQAINITWRVQTLRVTNRTALMTCTSKCFSKPIT